MASLSYFDEHLAWQQRVQKEVNAAQRTSPIYRSVNTKVLHRFKSVDDGSTVPVSRQIDSQGLGNLNVFAEVRGKYARKVNNMENFTLPAIKSRGSTSVTNKSKNSEFGKSGEFSLGSDFDSKTFDELKGLLRQERLRRMKAEREIKRREALERIAGDS